MLISTVSINLSVAYADSPFKNNFELTIGMYSPSIDTDLSLNPSDGSGSGIQFDYEDVFGLEEDKTLAFGEVIYRFNEHHAVEGSFLDLSRSSSRVANGDTTIGDTTFSSGSEVNTDLDYQIIRADYAYSFETTSDYSLAFKIGVYITDFKVKSEATLDINDDIMMRDKQVSDVTIPMPVIGLKGDWRVSENWLLGGTIDYFSLDMDEFDGSLVGVGASIEYDKFEYFSIGAGWEYYDLDIEIDADDFNGDLGFQYTGPQLFVKGRL